MNRAIQLMIISLGSIFLSCNKPDPTNDEIVGIWKSADGARLQFQKDGTFVGQALPGEIVFFRSKEFLNKKFNETGKWGVRKWQGQWVVNLSFDKSLNLTKGYDTRIFIVGEGMLENNPPWYLFEWTKEEGRQRYKFEKRQ